MTVAFIGDGTLGQGVVYESLNIASRWGLPLLIVVENNFYAQSTPSHLTLAGRIPDPGRGVRDRDGASWTRPTLPRSRDARRGDRAQGADEAGRSFSSSTRTATARIRRATTTATRRRSRRRGNAIRSA